MEQSREVDELASHFEEINFEGRVNSTEDRSVCTVDTHGTPTSSELQGRVDGDSRSVSSSKKSKKEKKRKKEKKHKKDKKHKKKKANAAEKLLDGEFENELEGTFDDFIIEAPSNQWDGHISNDWGGTDFGADFGDFHETPKTQSTSATMSSMGSKASLDNLKNLKPMLGPRSVGGGSKGGKSQGSGAGSKTSDDASKTAEQHRDMLQQFLKTSGQDEKLAMATAMAFENFILAQQQQQQSLGGPASASEMGSSRDESSDSDDGSGIDIDVEDHSDVSTLGWSCAEGDDDETMFGSSWADGTFIGSKSSEESSQFGNDFGEVRQNEKFIGRLSAVHDFNGGGGRRVPNRVAAAQGRAMQGGIMRSVSLRPPGSPGEERTFEDQMAGLSIDERGVVNALKVRWLKSGRPPFPNSWYLRFARSSPGRPFTFKTAVKSMKKYDQRYMNLTISTMEQQIRVKMLFPVKGLRSADGHEMFYMKPARYFPKKMSVSSVINNLIYVMDCMTEKESAQRDGIGFVANMDEWGMANFQTSYCYKFMMALQGKKTPVRVQLFLIVNPPSWFGSIWSIMKPMLSDEFRKKVKMIKLEDMKKYLHPTYEKFLPDDMSGGTVPTNQIIDEFITERRQVESARMLSSQSIH